MKGVGKVEGEKGKREEREIRKNMRLGMIRNGRERRGRKEWESRK